MIVYHDIPFTAREDMNLCADVYAPEGTVCRATLVWLHGGGLEGGSRKGVDPLAEALCENGIAMISVEYRLFPSAHFPDFLMDAAEAVRWTVDHAPGYALSERILLGGSSAGAYLSMMLCFDRRYLAAFDLEPEDIAGYLFDAGQPTTHFNVLKYRGMDERRVLSDEAAPLFHIQDSRPNRPLLITVSDQDMPCRLEQNQLLRVTLNHFGYDMSLVELHIMEGYTHTGYVFARDISGRMIYGDLVNAFLERQIFARES